MYVCIYYVCGLCNILIIYNIRAAARVWAPTVVRYTRDARGVIYYGFGFGIIIIFDDRASAPEASVGVYIRRRRAVANLTNGPGPGQ